MTGIRSVCVRLFFFLKLDNNCRLVVSVQMVFGWHLPDSTQGSESEGVEGKGKEDRVSLAQ